MASDAGLREQLIEAIDLALAGQWDAAHAIVQRHDHDPTACWIHAVLHRIEGDEANARYWYRRAATPLDPARDAEDELAAIRSGLG
jgi:hypothetical protein